MQSFLCRRCEACMCEDCVSMAHEYQELENGRKEAMFAAEKRHKEIQSTFDELKRKADMWENIAKAGLPKVVDAWIDKEVKQLLREGEPNDTTRKVRKNHRIDKRYI